MKRRRIVVVPKGNRSRRNNFTLGVTDIADGLVAILSFGFLASHFAVNRAIKQVKRQQADHREKI